MKKIVVTGDSGDLGAAICTSLLDKSDYSVIGLSRSVTPHVKRFLAEYPERYLHLSYDLEKSDEIKDFYLAELKNHGPLYGLVNNSAHPYDDIITNANLENLENMFRVNVFSPIMLTKYVIRDMLLHNVSGSLVHISSVSAHTGYKGLSMYASSKGALESFSRTVAREWGEKGIRSNCVSPGFMETRMSAALSKEQKDRIYKRTALKKATEIQSVAETVEFLLSDRSASITGSVIHVDSGTI
jgi:3-oxoacyl-[acyl-carrier protein] reductase